MKNLFFVLCLVCTFAACNSGGSGASSSKGGAVGEIELKVEKDADGDIIAEGGLLNGEKQGTWVTYHKKNGLVESIIPYNNGVPHGAFAKINDKGYITEKGVYKNGEFHGDYRKYIRSKIKEEAVFVNGKLDGIRKQYFDDGKIMSEGSYKLGVKDGSFKYYTQEGEVKFEQSYKNGEKVE